MIIKLLRLILGYVHFKATDGFPERFLNLCTLRGITLWNVKNDGVKVEAFTTIKGYKSIRNCAKKSGMKLKIIKKCGLPFFIKDNKLRVGVIVGVVLTIAFLSFSSCVLWDIEVTGNETIKTEILVEELEALGVKTGVIKSKLDTIKIKDELLKRYPELSWASINIFGTKAVLEVKENTNKPQIIDENTPSNLVAKKNGKITLVEGYKGTNVVKEGDWVVKGDLLISGVIENLDLSENLVRSQGKVFAETVTDVTKETEFQIQEKMVVENESKYNLCVLGIDIPMFYKSKGKKLYSGKKHLESSSGTLPFGVGWENFYEFLEVDIIFTETEAKLLSLLDVTQEKRTLFTDEAEIKKIVFKNTSTGTKNVTKCKIYAIEDIKEEVEILIE